MSGTWGRVKHSKVVHYYLPGSHESLCGRVKRRDWKAPDGWNEEMPGTCEHCKAQLNWIKQGWTPESMEV